MDLNQQMPRSIATSLHTQHEAGSTANHQQDAADEEAARRQTFVHTALLIVEARLLTMAADIAPNTPTMPSKIRVRKSSLVQTTVLNTSYISGVPQ